MVADVVVYENPRTRIVRAAGRDGSDIIVKVPRTPNAAARVRHEVEILRRLAGVSGVPELVEPPADAAAFGTVLAMRDVGGRSLAEVAADQPFGPADLVQFAIDLATVLAGIHRRGVAHKDLNPANVILVGEDRRPVLIDFDLATTVAIERPGFTHHGGIEGTLPYLAPEQTGRTGWAVDRRADLYALGATLYELATGEPPFGATGDALTMVHAHLTRVPAPLAERNPALPRAFSAIVAHLLEKEPDRRYQSADGLLYDLGLLQAALADGRNLDLVPGRQDFPWRLAPPTHLVGRERELAALTGALGAAASGSAPGLLVAGRPGVGKSSLLDQLRPEVTAAGGWLVCGKFDQYRQGQAADGLAQALASLARILLAEPEQDLAPLRARIAVALGADAPIVAALAPELEAALGVVADREPEHARAALARIGRQILGLFAAVASPQRPLVLVVDDLQWASRIALGFFDAVIDAAPPPGLLVVGAYRDTEVDETHPLFPLLRRWRAGPRPPVDLALENLARPHVATLIGAILRLPPAPAAALGALVAPRTGGNPFDTIEVINALRRDGVIGPAADGWSWDEEEVRRHLRFADPVELLAAQIGALPPATGEVLGTLACLGDDVQIDVLRAAIGSDADGIPPELDPALQDGLLVLEHGLGARVAFRHDRVRQAAYGSLDRDRRLARQLAVARRLAAHAPYVLLAAEQYLAAVDRVDDPPERARVADLFLLAARSATVIADLASAERYLTAASGLLGPGAPPAARLALDLELHAVLLGSGELVRGDEIWAQIAASAPPLPAARAAVRQVGSYTSRGMLPQAIGLACEALASLGAPAPNGDDVLPAVAAGIGALQEWVTDGSAESELTRAENRDARVGAIAGLLERLVPAAFFLGSPLLAWGVGEGVRLWRAHGPCPELVPVLAHAAFVTIPAIGDHPTGHRAVRRALAVAEGRGYEVVANEARFLLALSGGPWMEPAEEMLREARRAREGLIRAGQMLGATYTLYASVPLCFEAASVQELVAEADDGLQLANRIASEYVVASVVPWRQLGRCLAGSTARPGALDDESFALAAHLATLAQNPTAAANTHLCAALAAALHDDLPALDRHSAASVPLRTFVDATQDVLYSHALRGLALAGLLATAPAEERESLAAQLDTVCEWIGARADDAPENFGWLRRLLEAERAAALGDFGQAVRAFDAACRAASVFPSGWRAPFVLHRAGRFHLAAGTEYCGRAALTDAVRLYRAWGAIGPAEKLEAELPSLRSSRGAGGSRGSAAHTTSGVTAEGVDMLAVLHASQAIGSALNLARLEERIGEVLQGLTGASAVGLARRDGDGWLVGGRRVGADLLPFSVLRYVERTRAAVVVDDAAHDDRFARDPFLRARPGIALLCVPVLARGTVAAALVLESPSAGMFGAARLGAVELITGQLAVSLANAELYAQLEDKVAVRTAELRAANQALEHLAITDVLTGVVNRRRMNEVLDEAWREAGAGALAVVMLDVDHFKLFNDRYGHLGGDECLKRVATAISGAVRGGDTVAHGGEEFAVVLPDADLRVALQVAERIRAAIRAQAIPHEGSAHGVVTASVGVAANGGDGPASWEELVKVADGALYEAKRGGRDRVHG